MPDRWSSLLEQVVAPPLLPARASAASFADGARTRIEIASVEGPRVLATVLDEATRRDVQVGRVSQGSGVGMLDDAEITEMVELGREARTEVCLFLGPRAAWGTGAQAKVTEAAAGVARGRTDLAACLFEAERACALGIRSLLVGDIGVLAMLGRARAARRLPEALQLKTSAILCVANPASAALLEQLGATSLNLATDLDLDALAAIRAATSVPLDVYLEAPDDMGGSVRQHEVLDIVRAAAPVYLKFGLRNATSVYPAGGHLAAVAEAQAREKVRRARLALDLLAALEAGGEPAGS